MSAPKREPVRRAAFGHFHSIPTRWMDNDVYGHVNNVVYYSYFDTLIDHCGLDFQNGNVIGIAVETTCRFHRSFAYPEEIDAALAIGHLGKSSVRYEIGLFGHAEESARAEGHFVHVFVDRRTMRPTPITDQMRVGLELLRRI